MVVYVLQCRVSDCILRVVNAAFENKTDLKNCIIRV